MAEAQHQGLIRLPPPQPRKNKKAIAGVVGSVGVVVFGIVLWQMRGGKPPLSREMVDRPVAETKAREMPSQLRDDLKYPGSYNGQPLMAHTMPAPQHTLPDMTAERRLTATQSMQTSIQGVTVGEPTRRDTGTDAATGKQRKRTQHGGSHTQVQPVATTTQPSEWRWFSTPSQPSGDILLPPFPDDQKARAEQGSQSKLFPKAVWEMPEHPEKVLYASQLVYGQLQQGLNSDIPGTARIKVIQDVKDKWGQGNILIPMDTMFVARQAGKTQYGDERFHLEVYAAELPNGAALAWEGQVGDFSGASGVPATVDRHLLGLVGGTVLSAVLSIGARAPFGNTEGYQPSLPQELGRSVSQDINQSGQAIIQRELMRRPTLSQYAGFPVTLQFSKNISFQSKPILVKQ